MHTTYKSECPPLSLLVLASLCKISRWLANSTEISRSFFQIKVRFAITIETRKDRDIYSSLPTRTALFQRGGKLVLNASTCFVTQFGKFENINRCESDRNRQFAFHIWKTHSVVTITHNSPGDGWYCRQEGGQRVENQLRKSCNLNFDTGLGPDQLKLYLSKLTSSLASYMTPTFHSEIFVFVFFCIFFPSTRPLAHRESSR